MPAGSERLQRGSDLCSRLPLEPTGKVFTMLIHVDKIKRIGKKAKNSEAELDVDHLCLPRNLDHLCQRFTVDDSSGCDATKR